MLQKPFRWFSIKKFYNAYPPCDERTLRQLVRWFRTRQPAQWPEQKNRGPAEGFDDAVEEHEVKSTFINHSSVLIQTKRWNLLTDPIWSERCSPVGWFGPKRKALPGIRFEDLPPIDYVLISHNHYDHLDLKTLKKLQHAHHPKFYIAWGNAKLLHSHGIHDVRELRWWESATLSETLKITFVPAQHFSRRGVFDGNKTLWGGFVLEEKGAMIYFAGDTGFGSHFKSIHEKFGPIKLAFLPIGAYSPRWFMESVHMSPQDAVRAHLELEAEQSIGIHFGTFQLSDEAVDAPVEELKNALRLKGLSLMEFQALQNGQSLKMSLSKGV